MNKYVLFMVMILFLIFTTFLAQSIDANATFSILNNLPSGEAPSSILNVLNSVLALGATFFRLLTFQIEGIPAVFNIFIFYPLTFGILYMTIDIVRGSN